MHASARSLPTGLNSVNNNQNSEQFIKSMGRDGEIVTLDALHIVAIKNLRARTNGATKQ